MVLVSLVRLLTVLLEFDRLKHNYKHEVDLYEHIYSAHTIHLNLRPDEAAVQTEGRAFHGPLVLSEPGLVTTMEGEREIEREKLGR